MGAAVATGGGSAAAVATGVGSAAAGATGGGVAAAGATGGGVGAAGGGGAAGVAAGVGTAAGVATGVGRGGAVGVVPPPVAPARVALTAARLPGMTPPLVITPRASTLGGRMRCAARGASVSGCAVR